MQFTSRIRVIKARMQTRSQYLILTDLLDNNGFAKTCRCYVKRTWSVLYHLPPPLSSKVFRVYQNYYLLRTSVVILFSHVYLEYSSHKHICCSSLNFFLQFCPSMSISYCPNWMLNWLIFWVVLKIFTLFFHSNCTDFHVCLWMFALSISTYVSFCLAPDVAVLTFFSPFCHKLCRFPNLRFAGL
jgi:hypothetical protein